MKKLFLFLFLFVCVCFGISCKADNIFGSDDFYIKQIDEKFYESLKECREYKFSVEMDYINKADEYFPADCKEYSSFGREIVDEGKYCTVRFFQGSHSKDIEPNPDGNCKNCCGDGYAPGYCKFPKKILKHINKDNISDYAKYCERF